LNKKFLATLTSLLLFNFLIIGLFYFIKPQNSLLNSSSATISSKTRKPADFNDVVKSLEEIFKISQDPARFNSQNAAYVINQFADRAYAISGDDLNPKTEQEKIEFVEKADYLTKNLFALRLRLREKQKNFEPSWSAEEKIKAIEAFRRAQLYIRYAEDTVIDRWDQIKKFNRSGKYFGGDYPLKLVAPNQKMEFRAGDVFLVRGKSFVSATIARSGDVATNMSHTAMIAMTPSGELRVVESLLETGLVDYSLDHYLDFEHLPRAVLYRFKDQKLAKEAALKLWELREDARKKYIPFDIGMNVDEHSRVYCAEAVAMAFDRASNGEVKIPLHRMSFFKMQKTDFFDSIGMKGVLTSFAPIDVDMDHRFDLIAEHRDLDLLPESRRFDVALSYIFDKFKAGEIYYGNPFSNIESTVGYLARRLGFFKETISPDMSYKALLAMNYHRGTINNLVKTIGQVEETRSLELNRSLSYSELEEIVKAQCEPNRCTLKP
jgi:hypothetical protein